MEHLPTGTLIFYSKKNSFYNLLTSIIKINNGFWEKCGIIINDYYYEVNAKKGLIKIKWLEHKNFLENKRNFIISAYSLPYYQVNIADFQNDIDKQINIKLKYSKIRAFFSMVNNIKVLQKFGLWLLKKELISKKTFCSKFILKTLQTQPYLGELNDINVNTISPNKLKNILIDNKKLYSNLIILQC